MANQIQSPHPFQGILIHDERFSYENIDPTLTTATETGPHPDQPQPGSRRGFLQLEAFGDYGAAHEVQLVSVKEGPPVGGDSGGRFVWKEEADPDTDWRGHCNHNKPVAWRNVDGYHGSGTVIHPHAVRLPSGTVVMVCRQALEVRSYRLEESGAVIDEVPAWSAGVQVAGGAGSGMAANNPACLVSLPTKINGTNRLLCFYLLEGLCFSYSDDEGQTWVEGGRNVAGWDPPPGDLLRLRGLYHAGFITLVATYNNTDSGTVDLYHTVSDDQGGSFTERETISDRRWADLWVDSAGRVGMVYTNSSDSLYRAEKGTPFSKFELDPSWDTLVEAGGADSTSGGTSAHEAAVAIAPDEEGHLWLIFRRPDPDRYRLVTRRYDRDSMTILRDESSHYQGNPNYALDHSSDPSVYLSDFCLVPHRSSMLLLTIHRANNSVTDDTISELRLGGYDNIATRVARAWGQYGAASAIQQGMGWLAIEDAATVTSWTMTSSSASAALTLEGLQISSVSGPRYYTRSVSTPAAQHSYVHARARSDSPGSLTSLRTGLRLRGNDGTNSFEIELRISSTGVRLWDPIAAASLGPDQALESGVLYDFFVAMEKGVVSLWFKRADRELWTEGPQGQALGSTTLGSNQLAWGQFSSLTETAVFAFVFSSMDALDYNEELTTLTRPTGLQGRSFSQFTQTLADGGRLRAKGSSTYRTDQWTIRTRHSYGLDRLDPVLWPSPLQAWRSRDNTADQIVVWAPNGAEPTTFLSPAIGCYLELEAGTDLVYWEASTNGSTWTTLATLQASSQLTPSGRTLTYQLDGDWLRPASGTDAGGQYLQMDELAAVRLQDDGSFDQVLSVAANSAGVWRDSGRMCEVRVDGDLSAHTGSPVQATLISRQVLAVVHNVQTAYSYFRLRIPAQGTTDGGGQGIRAMAIGPVLIWGQTPAWGRRFRELLNVTRHTTANGTRWVEERSTPKRVVDIAWPDGWDMSAVSGDDPDPDYHAAYSGAPGFTAIGDASLVARTLYRARSGAIPVVYIPRIEEAIGITPEAQVHTSRERMLFGLLEADNLSREVLVGDEFRSEVVAVSSLTIREQ